MIELRQYQNALVDKVRVRRRRCSLIVLPTGAGKTVVLSEIIRLAENQHVLVFVHRREIIFQIQSKLAEFGVEAGVILAGEPLNLMARVQIASVQTLSSRYLRRRNDLPHADIVAIDEAHHVTARTYRQILKRYPEARVIGLTATPCRRDGRGLGSDFEEMIEGPQVDDLIKLGFLVPTKTFAPQNGPNLKDVHTRQGDYVEGELAAVMDRAELVGDIVTHYLRHASSLKTIIYATSVGHSIHICEELIKAGVRAAHIDGQTPKEERDEILKKLAQGDIDVVVNCMVLTEGFDLPDVRCIILARPTKSVGLYRQMIGRGLRPAPGKDHCVVLDHAGATHQHGFVEDPVIWTLQEDKRATTPAQDAPKGSSLRELVTCSQCEAVRTGGKPCPNCGFLPKRPAEYLHVIDGDLARIDRNGKITPNQYTYEQKREFHAGLLHLALSRGNKPGAAAHRFKEKFGHWPLDISVVPVEPTPEVIAWDRHCRIRYAKAMQNRARRA